MLHLYTSLCQYLKEEIFPQLESPPYGEVEIQSLRVVLFKRGDQDDHSEIQPDFYAKDLWEAWEWIKQAGQQKGL